MAINLTENAIAILSRGETLGPEFKPVLQVTDVRSVNSQNANPGSERFRLMLSDGTHMQQGMLGTQRNDLVKNGRLQKGSLVQLNSFVCNTIQGRMIIIIIDLELILDMCELIGEPKHFIPNNADNSTPPQPRPSPQFQPSMNNQSTAHVNPQSYHTSPLSSGPQAKPTVGSSTNFHSPEMNRGAAGSFSYGNNNNNSYNSPTPSTRFPANNNPTNNMRTAQHIIKTEPRVLQQPAYNNQPPPMYLNRGPVARNEAAPCITPIGQLNPYQGRWTIKARVTAKTELRHYNNAKGDGKVFSFDLLDSDGGELRTTCFNAVADLFYNQIESGSVYIISKGSLKPAQRNFNHLNSEHELVLDQNSSVILCEDDSSIPRQLFKFRLISEIEGIENNAIIDLIGVVTSISPTTSLTKKNGQETQKRVLQLKDMSGRSVELTLWGSFCNAEGQTIQQFYDSEGFVILAVKSGRINDFNGKAVGTLSTTQFVVNPDFPEAQKLKVWYEQEGKNIASVSFSKDIASMGRTDVRKMISQIKDEKLGMSEKPDWITVCATISFIKSDPFYYTACPNKISDERQCTKKVVNNGDGKWQCDRCVKSFDQCDYRYILQLQLQDHTSNTWATAFQEMGEEILGISAKDLYVLKYEDKDEEGFGEILRRVIFQKYIVKLMVKEETFNDEPRVKLTVKKAEKVKFASETKHLLSLLGNSSEKSSFLPPKAENVTPFVSNPTSSFNSTGFGNAGFRENSTPVTSMRNTASAPASQPGQYGNNYSGSRFPGSGPTSGAGGYLSCNSCGETGHSSMNCPSVIGGGGGFDNSGYSGGGGGGGGGQKCFNCNQVGHWKKDCPNAAGGGGGYSGSHGSGGGGGYSGGHGGGGVSGECYNCHKPGHWSTNCPLKSVPPAYGGNSGGSGRYDNSSGQHVGGF